MSNKKSIIILITAIFLILEASILINFKKSSAKPKTQSTLQFQIDSVRENPLDPERYLELSKIVDSSDTKKIEALLKKTVSLNPFSMKYNLALANFYKNIGNLDGAMHYFKKAIELPINIGGAVTSQIQCEMAEISLIKGDTDSFKLHIEKARERSPNNWKIDFLYAREAIFKDEIKNGLNYLESSFKKYRFYSDHKAKNIDSFKSELNSLLKDSLKMKKWENVRLIYDRYAMVSGYVEETLLELEEKFKKYPDLIKDIWDDKIHITLLESKFLDKPILLNQNDGCGRKSLDHKLDRDSKVYETIAVEYLNAPAYVDLFYVPSNFEIKSDRTSARIFMESNDTSLDRQITVAILNNLYYSKGLSVDEGEGRIRLEAKNLLNYTTTDLLLRPKGYNIYVTKVGFNTACRDGVYRLESIEIYLEDQN